ncbi:MAG: hypothetical protein SH847_01305 [Roseiflexaceae bacterium]|nr:hypothetical protein [Roseiflexaceae bacterium]
MVERLANPHIRLCASGSYDRTPCEVWPELIARAHQFGIEAIVIRPAWVWHTHASSPTELQNQAALARDLIGFVVLCAAAELAIMIDLAGLGIPPINLLRAHPAIATPESNGLFRVQPLHPALIAEARKWIAQLSMCCLPLQQPEGPIVALLASNLPATAIGTLDEWVRSDGWQIPLLPKLPTIDLSTGWPFEHNGLYAGDIETFFRTDGSAYLRLWNIKPFVTLVRSMAIDLPDAQPPAGPTGIRDAWADGPEIDISVRHNKQITFLSIQNRRTEPYSGMLTYRNHEGELLHLHANLGPQRQGVVLLQGEEIAGVAFTGDASEGVWLVRAMRSSIVFNGGAGGVTPSGRGVVLMAAQSGRFQLRRMEGWANIQAYRLTMHGRLLACPCQIEAQHLTVPYIAEDQHGQTDQYIILATNDPLPDAIETHLRVLLKMRAAEVHTIASICRNGIQQQLTSAATLLESTATNPIDLTIYRNVWASTEQHIVEVAKQIQHEHATLQFSRQMIGEEPPGEEEAWRTQALAHLQHMLNQAALNLIQI